MQLTSTAACGEARTSAGVSNPSLLMVSPSRPQAGRSIMFGLCPRSCESPILLTVPELKVHLAFDVTNLVAA